MIGKTGSIGCLRLKFFVEKTKNKNTNKICCKCKHSWSKNVSVWAWLSFHPGRPFVTGENWTQLPETSLFMSKLCHLVVKEKERSQTGSSTWLPWTGSWQMSWFPLFIIHRRWTEVGLLVPPRKMIEDLEAIDPGTTRLSCINILYRLRPQKSRCSATKHLDQCRPDERRQQELYFELTFRKRNWKCGIDLWHLWWVYSRRKLPRKLQLHDAG